MAGTIQRGRLLHDQDTGVLAGYVNPVTGKPEAFASASGAGIFGPYADPTALQAAKPAASNPGSMAYVGASAPYAQYVSTGSAWVLVGGSGGAYEVADWAALLALTGVPDGREYAVLAPVCTGGVPGTRWRRAASLTPTGWVLSGGQTLAMLTTQVDGAVSTVSEQTLWEPQFEPGVLASIQSIRLRSRVIFSAADTNTRTLRWRVRDTSTGNVIAVTGTAAANARWAPLPGFLNPVSATSSRQWLTIPTGSVLSPDEANVSTAASSDLTIPDLAATAIYLGLSVQQGSTPLGIASLSLAQIYGE